MTTHSAIASTRPITRSTRVLMGPFAVERWRVILRKTGNSAPMDLRLAGEVVSWLGFQAALHTRATLRRLTRPPGPAIWFTPDLPGPWYMTRAVAAWAGVRVATSPERADAGFFFEDTTVSRTRVPRHDRSYNFGCTDISKSRVAAVFADVFGYPLAIDPLATTGRAVEKGEVNGAHDGRIVRCPTAPVAGKTYQRLIDTVEDDGCARDLRTHCIGGTPVLVWLKRRAADKRFLPPNLSVTTRAPHEVFSPEELASIGRFAHAMQLDWGGLDILRDRASGRIYVVDVNKTDAGPITSLPFREKLASMAILADALLAMLENGQAGVTGESLPMRSAQRPKRPFCGAAFRKPLRARG